MNAGGSDTRASKYGWQISSTNSPCNSGTRSGCGEVDSSKHSCGTRRATCSAVHPRLVVVHSRDDRRDVAHLAGHHRRRGGAVVPPRSEDPEMPRRSRCHAASGVTEAGPAGGGGDPVRRTRKLGVVPLRKRLPVGVAEIHPAGVVQEDVQVGAGLAGDATALSDSGGQVGGHFDDQVGPIRVRSPTNSLSVGNRGAGRRGGGGDGVRARNAAQVTRGADTRGSVRRAGRARRRLGEWS